MEATSEEERKASEDQSLSAYVDEVMEKPQRNQLINKQQATGSAFCGQCGAPSSWDSVDISFRSERQKPSGTITADMISEIKMEPVNGDNLSYGSQISQEEQPNRFDQGFKFNFGPQQETNDDEEPSLIQEASNSSETPVPVVAASSLALLAEENAQMKDDLEKRL